MYVMIKMSFIINLHALYIKQAFIQKHNRGSKFSDPRRSGDLLSRLLSTDTHTHSHVRHEWKQANLRVSRSRG